MSTLSVEDQAFAIMAPRKLHQMFKIPATDKHDVLKVTYAIAGPDIGEDVPTILFCGGMFGTRYMAMSYNIFAENQRVRMIFFDRSVHIFVNLTVLSLQFSVLKIATRDRPPLHRYPNRRQTFSKAQLTPSDPD